MISYTALKHLHLLAVVLTLIFFVLRSGGLLLGGKALNRAWMRLMHHGIDLIVLASALALCAAINQWPFYNSGWVTAKFIGLIGYFSFTALALSRAKPYALGIAASFFIYAAWVAVSKTPFPF